MIRPIALGRTMEAKMLAGLSAKRKANKKTHPSAEESRPLPIQMALESKLAIGVAVPEEAAEVVEGVEDREDEEVNDEAREDVITEVEKDVKVVEDCMTMDVKVVVDADVWSVEVEGIMLGVTPAATEQTLQRYK